MEQSDHELLALLAGDLHRHFKEVVIRYQHRLYAFANRLTGSSQDAEDIVQEAFVSAYVSLENYPSERVQALKLQAWLYRVVLNVYTHHARSMRLQLVSLDHSSSSPALEIEDPEEERPELVCESQEQRLELEHLLAGLPERYRIALTCYYFEHLTYQEIAELLEQPSGTVKSNVSRGLRLLRTMLTAQAQEGKEYTTWSTMSQNDRKA